MPKRILPLSDIQIKNAKPKEKQFTLFDGGGLFIIVTPTGGKLWKMKYRFKGNPKTISLGSYPETSIIKARKKKEEARELIANGFDPLEVRKAQKEEDKDHKQNTFENIAKEWHTKFSPQWAETTAGRKLRMLDVYVFPYIGNKPIKEVKSPDVLEFLRRIEARGILETAKSVKIICGQIFNYAIATGRSENDPTTALKGALPPAKVKHYASITDPSQAAGLLRAIDDYQGSIIVKCALQLAPLFFVRPGELRQAEWTEIDFDQALWSIPPEKMKIKSAHIVPLAHQAVKILKELQKLTGTSKYVFPSARSIDRPMSDNAVNAALRRMGFEKDEMTGHGFRAMARTILDEVLHIRPDFIEHQLAHAVRDPNGRAYNRTAHLEERRKMMQTWADYLDSIKSEKNKSLKAI